MNGPLLGFLKDVSVRWNQHFLVGGQMPPLVTQSRTRAVVAAGSTIDVAVPGAAGCW